MLNEHERESLRQIQLGFAAEDPTFTDHFNEDTEQLRQRQARAVKVMRAVVIVLLILMVLMLILGLAGPAFVFAAMIAALVAWRHRGSLAYWVQSRL